MVNANQMWNLFKLANPNLEDGYEAWGFGVDADLLASLVLKGEKTATSSLYLLYETESHPLPKTGSYHIILDSNENAICIIEITKVYIEEFKNISEEHAYKEGEGDKSLQYWRSVHDKFFSQCMLEVGKEFTDNMKVVCEEFKVVYK
ncbi:ASCH domain-containing protein [Clostridium sp.]|uniref:ASCH domain-containing protein n=1 Tax=Clostridium sp. TaxID=1506 RepID=UPI003FA530DC